MKHLFSFFVVATLLLIVGCSKEYDDSALVGRVDDLENRVQRLEQLCQQMNTNISSLQTIVTALQKNDYVTGVMPITENGKTIGYTITFAKAQSITIYHGKDGQNGADGKDGQDGADGADGKDGADGAPGKDGENGKDGADGKDGYTPIIGVKQDTDGIYYWTLDGEWLLDDAGNKIKAQGVDGKDGTNGTDGTNGADGKDGEDGKDGTDGVNGADGKDGITPQLKIENDYWYVSYDNGASWTQLGKATGEDGKDGTNGTDGADGKSFFQDVTQDENNVYFTLADGTIITLPKGAALSITFDSEDLVVMATNSTREIGYTVTSSLSGVKVEAIGSGDIKAKAVASSELSGVIKVTTGATIDEYSKVVVLVSNGEKVIMRTLTFEKEEIKVENEAKMITTADGGEVELLYLSNVECEVIIPDSVDWISVAPATRALEQRSIKLILEPNTEYYRSAIVTLQSPDGNLSLEYTIEQDGDKGVYIDPTKIPDNEIWYVTNKGTDGYVSSLDPIAFDANIIEHVYEGGKWIIRFDDALKTLKFPSLCGLTYETTITELYLPNSLEHLENMATNLEITEFYVPKNLKSLYMPEISWGEKLERFLGDNVSKDGRCIVINDKLCAFAPVGIEEYTIPEGITTIGQQAIRSEELKSIIVPEGVTTLESEAFCSHNIEYINLPSSLTQIGSYAFFQLHNLKKISGNCKFISDDGYSLIIDDYFQGKTFLTNFASGADITSYEIPEGVNGIESYAFYKAESLKELSFPSTLADIASENSFLGTYNIEKIYGPNVLDDNKSLVVDGTLLYVAPKGLKEYTTPKGVTKIPFGGLAQKPELESIVISDDVLAVGDALSCRPYEIPIGYILWNNSNLKTVTISANIKILGMDPFGTGGGSKREASLNIETVYLRAPIPPVIGHNFPDEIPSLFPNLTIYVPEQSLEAYLGSPDWTPYRGYIKGYNYTDLPENDTYISSDYSKDGIVTTLQTATKGEGIDIVLMGDAYSDRQIADGSYKADMENLYNNLFTEEPYKSFKDHFNVYYVNVVSATEGYEYGNTALDGYFGDGTLVGGNDNAVFDYALNAISEGDMDEALLIVAMNSDNYAGTCYMYYPETNTDYGKGVSVSYFPKGGEAETFAQLLHHEACGHGFAKLADEYAYEDMGAVPSDYVSQIQSQQNSWGWWKNVDFTSDPTATRWSHFINDSRYTNERVGAYEGG